MKDILGRELKENDLVIGMVIARGSDGMRHGVFNGTSVDWIKYGGSYITTSTMNNMYLVENPCEKELEIKQKIKDKLEEGRKESEERVLAKKLMKRIPAKDLVIGKFYQDDSGGSYIYLGKGKVTDSYKGITSEGFIYLYPCFDYNKVNDTVEWLPSYSVLKNPKKLVSESINTDRFTSYDFSTKKEFILKEERSSSFYRNGRSITIKLD